MSPALLRALTRARNTTRGVCSDGRPRCPTRVWQCESVRLPMWIRPRSRAEHRLFDARSLERLRLRGDYGT